MYRRIYFSKSALKIAIALSFANKQFLSAVIENQQMITTCHEFLSVESSNTISYMMQESSMFGDNLSTPAMQDYSKLTEKRFKCFYCSKSFKQKIHLMKHIRIHTGEKPFVCSVCNTAFRQKEHLKNHLLVHMKNTLDPPFMHNCTHCGANFRSAYFLQRHVLKFHGENA